MSVQPIKKNDEKKYLYEISDTCLCAFQCKWLGAKDVF